jgi:hypothetical protein
MKIEKNMGQMLEAETEGSHVQVQFSLLVTIEM